MKHFLHISMLLLALMVLALPIAKATPTISVSYDGGAAVLCADQAVCDTNSTLGAIAFSNPVGVFIVNSSTGTTKPVQPMDNMDLFEIQVQSGVGTHDLVVMFSDTDFIASPGYHGTIGGTITMLAGSTITASAYYSNALNNNLFQLDNLIGSTGAISGNPFGGSFSGPGPNYQPYSLTQVMDLHTTGAGTFSGDFALAPVPEPSALFLFGSGVAALGFLKLRKRTNTK